VNSSIDGLCDPEKSIVKHAVNLVRERSACLNFKKTQSDHFEKHSKVKQVVVNFEKDGQNHIFKIQIHGCQNNEDILKDVLKNMKEEYEGKSDENQCQPTDSPKIILDEFNIEVSYKCNLLT
jgi:hypothetical protein